MNVGMRTHSGGIKGHRLERKKHLKHLEIRDGECQTLDSGGDSVSDFWERWLTLMRQTERWWNPTPYSTAQYSGAYTLELKNTPRTQTLLSWGTKLNLMALNLLTETSTSDIQHSYTTVWHGLT